MNSEEAQKKAEQAYAASDDAQPGDDVSNVQSHNLSPLAGNSPVAGEGGNIDLLMDISVPIVARLGSTEMKIRDILQLQPGSIVELDKLAGDPVDLFVRGKLFAQGEVVVVDESFGIRVTKILDPSEKVQTLVAV